MADPHESSRYHVLQKATKKLLLAKCHQPRAIAVGVLLPAKRHETVLMASQSMIGDGDAMGVTTKVIEHLLWASKWALGVDDLLHTP